MKIAICDDTAFELEQISSYARDFAKNHPDKDISISVFCSANELLQYIQKNGDFDIYLLDIIMPDMNGIHVGEKIRLNDKNAIIIYLTASTEYALDAFHVFAYQYLLKPITKESLFDVLEKVLTKLTDEAVPVLAVKQKNGIVNIPFHTITFGELFNRTACFHLSNKTVIQSVYLRSSFDKVIAPLLSDPKFVHPHKSFVVNMNYIIKASSHGFEMQHGELIPIAQSNYTAVKNKYMKYLLEKPFYTN